MNSIIVDKLFKQRRLFRNSVSLKHYLSLPCDGQTDLRVRQRGAGSRLACRGRLPQLKEIRAFRKRNLDLDRISRTTSVVSVAGISIDPVPSGLTMV